MKRLIKNSMQKLTYELMEKILIENNIMDKNDILEEIRIDENNQFDVYIGYDNYQDGDYEIYREQTLQYYLDKSDYMKSNISYNWYKLKKSLSSNILDNYDCKDFL